MGNADCTAGVCSKRGEDDANAGAPAPPAKYLAAGEEAPGAFRGAIGPGYDAGSGGQSEAQDIGLLHSQQDPRSSLTFGSSAPFRLKLPNFLGGNANNANGPKAAAGQAQAPPVNFGHVQSECAFGGQGAAGPLLQTCYFERELDEQGPIIDDGHCPQYCRHLYETGSTYDGEWLGCARHGRGVQRWADGTVYLGQWEHGRAAGLGQLRHCDGDIYTGEWANGRAEGRGVFQYRGDAATYEGEFQADFRHGVGVEIWVEDGSWYAGDFERGAKHGFGEHRWPDDTRYVGAWRANEIAGLGHYEVAPIGGGAVYSGGWADSAIHGMGVYRWPSGWRYEGQYANDTKHGFGVLISAEGLKSAAYWRDGVELEGSSPLRGSVRGSLRGTNSDN